MIICTKQTNIDEAEVVLTKTKFGYLVKTKYGFEFEFDSRLVDNAPDIMFLNKDQFGKPAFTWFSESTNTRDGYLSSRIRKRIQDPMSMCVAIIGIDEFGESHAFAFGNTHITNEEERDPSKCVEVGMSFLEGDLAYGKSSSEVMAECVPSMSKYVKRMREKQLAIGKISETDSLAALEAQVDMLTHGLSVVMALVPEESQPSWWGEFKKTVFPISSVDNETEDGVRAAFDTISKQKAFIRSVQQQYYSKVKSIYAD